MTTPHPQADLLRAIADGKQMQELDFPGINHPGNWCDCDADRALNLIIRGVEQYVRIKPETVTINDTVTINGIECNAPMRVAPALQTIYFKPDPDWEKMYDRCMWAGRALDHSRFSLGLCFATANDAAAAARAMIAPLKGGAE